MIKLITLVLQIFSIVIGRWTELDKEKRAKKKKLVEEIGNAKKIIDKKQRASALNSIVRKSRRV